ncbi:hypothetical protein LZ554_009598 [Drepanopeziza brunnea f. sp. 'monogermtubi']|nr:hypothetical protein LZ554_009598 [Drepanopeziza brunnea f. sp. 'monogermtubi']
MLVLMLLVLMLLVLMQLALMELALMELALMELALMELALRRLGWSAYDAAGGAGDDATSRLKWKERGRWHATQVSLAEGKHADELGLGLYFLIYVSRLAIPVSRSLY